MVDSKDLGKEFPSIVDRAYSQRLRYPNVTEIMSRNIASTVPSATMAEAAKIMGERHVGSLIVFEYSTPIGIITERDLLTNVLANGKDPKNVKVLDEMSYPLITLCSTATIKEAAKTMIQKKGRLAVYECGNLIGIVTASDLVRSMPEAPETESKVDEFMTRDVTMVDDTTAVSNVAVMMGINRIGSVVVTVKNQPKGIFTERDLLTTFLAKGVSLDVPVGERASPLITAPSGISIHEAAQVMRSKHIKRLPIMKDNALTGIVTARDLVEAYAK